MDPDGERGGPARRWQTARGAVSLERPAPPAPASAGQPEIDPLITRAVAARAAGRSGEAEACLRRVVELDPGNARVLNELGLVLRERGRVEEAIAAYERALAALPALADPHVNLGNVRSEQGRLGEAVAHYRRALALQPAHAQAWNNLAIAWREQGRLEEADTAARRALEIQPAFPVAHSNLLYQLNFRADLAPAQVFEEHRGWGARYADALAARGAPAAHDPDPGRPLRIGYVSPDLRMHSVAFFLEPLLVHHDRERFAVWCYSNAGRADHVTERLRGLVDGWRDIRALDDAAACERIRADRIDVLVDLAGHTSHHRLLVFARRPAPVQVTWLGYPNTTGMAAMDHRITDAIADPPGDADRWHSERLLRLDGGFLCYRPPFALPDAGVPPSWRGEPFTFGSFGSAAKIGAGVIEAWAALLHRVGGARLLLKARQLGDAETCERILAGFRRLGVPDERVLLQARISDKREHFAAYRGVDVALDTFPYNGTTTICEALWMGVPVVSLAGRAHAARVGASLLTAAGLAELIARTRGEYVARALELAGDVERLRRYRETLRPRLEASPLGDGRAFAARIEHAFRSLWAERCARSSSGSAPAGAPARATSGGPIRGDAGASAALPEWILVVGMPRSGSTWSYNVARELLALHGVGTADGFVGERGAVDAHLERCGAVPETDRPRLIKFHALTDRVRGLLARGAARALYTQRDLRDVVVSRMDFDGVSFDALLERRQVEAAMAAHARWIEQPALLRVEYADVVARPAAAIARIAGWLGLDVSADQAAAIARRWTPAAAREHAARGGAGRVTARAASAGAREYDAVSLLHRNHVVSGAVGRFRERLSPAQIARLEAIAGDWLAREGYLAGAGPERARPGPAPASGWRDASADLAVRIAGGVRVHVPGSIERLSTYVLLEQEDWFEDEIRFARGLLRPGDQVLDVGASFGVYALSAAAAVGAGGRVIAFEPAADPASRLEASARDAGFGHLEVVRAAVAERAGEERFAPDRNSEYGRLAGGDLPDAARVPVVALDALEGVAPERLALVKVDAEGAETRVIEGARALLARARPLVMFEIKRGTEVELAAAGRLRSLGYDLYRLLPGPALLVPFGEDEVPERYQLNLFACPPERAEALEARGLLARAIAAPADAPDAPLAELLGQRPWAGDRIGGWGWDSARATRTLRHRALRHWATAQDGSLPAAVRAAHLRFALALLGRDRGDERGRYLSLARVAWEAGERARAVAAVNDALARLEPAAPADAVPEAATPFLPPAPRFDGVPPGDDLHAWLLAAALEHRERVQAFSSWFTGRASLAALERLHAGPHAGAEMARRRQLVRMRAGLRAAPAADAALAREAPDHLNAALWAAVRAAPEGTGRGDAEVGGER